MNAIVSDLVEFVKKGRVSGALVQIEAEIGTAALRVVAIKFLGWLKSRARGAKERPLEMRNDFHWCLNLKAVLSVSAELSSAFMISCNTFDFAPSVSQSDRRKIEKFVDENYKPRIMT
jgi:hypothetical protein